MSHNDGSPDLNELLDTRANRFVFSAYCNGYPELENSREELLAEMLSPVANATETTYQLGLIQYKHVVAAFARYTYEEVVIEDIDGTPKQLALQRAAGAVTLAETTRRHLEIMRFFVPRAPEISADILPVTYRAGESAGHAFNSDLIVQQANNGKSKGPKKSAVEVMSTAVEGFITTQVAAEQGFIDGMFRKGL